MCHACYLLLRNIHAIIIPLNQINRITKFQRETLYRADLKRYLSSERNTKACKHMVKCLNIFFQNTLSFMVYRIFIRNGYMIIQIGTVPKFNYTINQILQQHVCFRTVLFSSKSLPVFCFIDGQNMCIFSKILTTS